MKELKWEATNLKYAKTFSTIRELEDELEELTAKYQDIQARIKKEEELKLAFTLKLRLHERDYLRKQLNEQVEKANELKRVLKVDDLENEIARNVGSIKNQWDKTRVAWTETKREHVHYMN
ncbi:hypothetical protein OSJ97_24085, partial [Escherichia coli]|nr:hypothetical protein [Escherichia coli]